VICQLGLGLGLGLRQERIATPPVQQVLATCAPEQIQQTLSFVTICVILAWYQPISTRHRLGLFLDKLVQLQQVHLLGVLIRNTQHQRAQVLK
jgi:hypothetical protein